MANLNGTGQADMVNGTSGDDVIVGLEGDDIVNAGAGEDLVYGDFSDTNILEGIQSATSFTQYGETGAWTVSTDGSSQTSMSQTVSTSVGGDYSVEFELAANYGANVVSGAVEVLWNGEVIDSFDTNSAIFEGHEIAFEGTGAPGELTFRSIESASENPLDIQMDAPVLYYEKDVTIDGQTVSVDAFAPGQANIYQVLDGTLNVFDPETATYSLAGVEGTVVVNSIGYNQEDDLIYGIAVKNGVDSLGNTVERADIVMIDASGASFRVGEGPYRAWTGDFDGDGNLWAFHSSMDRITKIDVDNLDENGNPVTVTYDLPNSLVTSSVWDVAYDASTQTFSGVIKPPSEGANATLITIDLSDTTSGGQPVFTYTAISATLIDGVMETGVPKITFGAAVLDGDGNLYVGGNGGDHDMDNATSNSGGIYKVVTDELTGVTYLELVTDAPKAYSNDGAIDPRAMDPFTEIDQSASVLIRSPEMTTVESVDLSYDDQLNGQAGQDEMYGGYGEDILTGASLGDTLEGNQGNDILYGGAGPGWIDTGVISIYDEGGLRFDQFGNLLPEDDDTLIGGIGSDILDGSAGHDTLSGGSGGDTLSGGSGNDVMSGGDGDDILSGGSQDDILSGNAGDDDLQGGTGNDDLSGGGGTDDLDGGSGDDTLSGDSGSDTLSGGSGDDALSGGNGDDILDGGSGDDDLEGDAGNDVLAGGSGNDTIDGGDGVDTIDGGKGNDTIQGGAGKDRIKGGSGDDDIEGGDGKDYINAGSGDDTIDGGDNRDKIYMGAGADVAFGGDGNDVFVFRSEDIDGSTDLIVDFTNNGSENDTLDLSQLDLLVGGTASEWTDANVSLATGQVSIDLNGTTLLLNDGLGLGEVFLDQVCDAFIF